MAEFCLACWNKINKSEYSEEKYILSDYLDLCEGCGEWKHVIVVDRKAFYMHKFRYFVLPIKIIYIICGLLLFPFLIWYRIYDYKKSKKQQKKAPLQYDKYLRKKDIDRYNL